MDRSLRLFIISGPVVLAFVVAAIELTRHGLSLFSPLHLLLFIAGMAFYLLPTELALYKQCEKAEWIAIVNVFLGWTLVGWVIALGCAESARIRTLCPSIALVRSRPLRH